MHKVLKRVFEDVLGREVELAFVSQDLHRIRPPPEN